MKPYFHAKISEHVFGGSWKDYQDIHTFFDLSKAVIPDMRHRLMLHSDYGCFIAGEKYGKSLVLSNGTLCDTSKIFEQHNDDDVGRVVSLEEWMTFVTVPTSLKIKIKLPEYKDFQENPQKACQKRWGGQEHDYQKIIDFFYKAIDYAKCPEKGRLIGFNAFTIMLSDIVYGPTLENSEGCIIPTRDIGEALTLSIFGKIPTLNDVLSSMKTEYWMYGSEIAARRKIKKLGMTIPLTD